MRRSPQNVPILYNGPPFLPPQNCPLQLRNWTPSNTWFLGPTIILNPNGISIGSAVFAGLTTVYCDRSTDRPTDHHATRFVSTGRIYVRSTAMRPNNATTTTILLRNERFLGDRLYNGSPYAIGPLSVCPVFLSVLSCPVCDAGVLWPNNVMDQDETWRANRPHCK